jgi:hypothetical protein
MKKAIGAIAFLAFMAGTGFARAADREYFPDNLYITSYYTVEVYNESNRKIGFLYSGVRARVIKSAKYWLYVEFWDGRKIAAGWIRR